MTLWCPNLTLLPSHHHKLNASITPTLWALLFLFTCQPLGSMFQHVCALSQSYCFFPEFALLFHRRQWQPTPVFLPGKSHGQRSLVGYSPWGREESDTTKWLHFHFSLSCTGEGNGTHSSVLAWRIPGTAEPGGLPSMGSHRVGHDWSDLAAAAALLFYLSPP